jgi:ribonucleoside-diphosphate reductase beta chain
MSNVVEHAQFRLLTDPKNTFTLFPILNDEIYELYKKHLSVFWTVEEVDLVKDKQEWETLTDNERHFITCILAFFAASDGIVAKNLDLNFSDEIDIKEVQVFYRFQGMVEDIHSEMYSVMIDTFITDKQEKDKAFNAINHYPCIKEKADWALKWTNRENNSIASRLLAFTIVEGVFFSGAFCAIFWLKKSNKMPGLTVSNEFISRDEGLHTDFGILMYRKCKDQLSKETVNSIFKEAVSIEKQFITDSIPCALLGMNNILMCQYIEYVSDRLLVQLGYDKLYNTKNPFTFMENISINNKTNFFEERVSEYNKSGVGSSKEDMNFELDEDF